MSSNVFHACHLYLYAGFKLLPGNGTPHISHVQAKVGCPVAGDDLRLRCGLKSNDRSVGTVHMQCVLMQYNAYAPRAPTTINQCNVIFSMFNLNKLNMHVLNSVTLSNLMYYSL